MVVYIVFGGDSMITIGSFKDMSEEYDEIWIIVRSLKSTPYIPNTQVYHVPTLSPSPDLFNKYLTWRNNGKWNEDTFQNKYVPQFLHEMHSTASKNSLNALFYKAKGKHILLACFCPNEALCHRSIVCGLLQGVGCETSADDYSYYYKLYKEL